MKRLIGALFIAWVGIALTCANGWAQATAQISGAVRDQSGAVLPGVEVTATQTETGIARATVTNETGSFILPNLALGPYRLEAALPGFRTFVQTGIVLQVNSAPVVNAVLEVGQITEQIEVQANAAQVETRSTAVGQVIENERILELPLNGRQVTDLITLSGAAVQTGVGNSQTWQGAVMISIAGGQNFGVGYSLDGAMHNNPYDGTQMPLPFPDALQEFKVEASGSGANGGMKSGGSVNGVTKSGTNEFHGDAFEFVRNYLFNARNYFALKRDSLKRNQFGGTLGGPIVKNKLFFFGGYQGTLTRSDPGDSTAFVPTAAMLAGDWTAITSPACNSGRQIQLRAPFSANNTIDPALLSKAAVAIARKLPAAQDQCGKVTYGLVNKPNELQAVGKVDYQFSASHSVFGRYLATTLSVDDPYSLSGNLLTTVSNGWDNLAQSYALGDTYLFGPNTVNALRLTVNRVALHRVGPHFFGPKDVGVNAYSSLPDNMVITITGGPSIGSGTNSEATFRTTAYQLADDISIVQGTHQWAFGANVAQWRTNQYAYRAALGNYNFNGSIVGLGMADFLTGRLNTLNQGSPTSWGDRQSVFATYIADTWKITPKLTVNYGLRWEPFLPLRLTQGAVYNFDKKRFDQGIKSTVYPTGPAGFYFPGDPGFPEKGSVFPKWLNLAPRLGFAWDPKGDGTTSIRASYGIAYDFSGSNTLNGSATSPPWAFNTTVTNPAGGFEDPWRDFPAGNPFPYVLSKTRAQFPPFASFYPSAEYHMDPTNVQTWNLSVQRQFAKDVLMTVSYLGSQTTHLWVQRAFNQAIFLGTNACTLNGVSYPTCSTTTNTDQRRLLTLQNPVEGQFIGALNMNGSDGTANYNGLLISVQRRAVNGINIGGNYTWAHCIGDKFSAGGPGAGGYLDRNNRRFDRGNCDSDRRQYFNVTAVAQTPQFTNNTMRMIASGWRVSGIYRKSTGSYMTITTGQDRALNGDAGPQRPNQILGNPYGDKSSLTNYLNPQAFAQPALGTIGNMGTYNIIGPSTFQFDMALSRVFGVREGQNIEVRAEAFNVTNSLRRGNPGVTAAGNTAPTVSLSSNTFGQILTSGDARVMQFALKYTF
jgi:hypothetical protein